MTGDPDFTPRTPGQPLGDDASREEKNTHGDVESYDNHPTN